MKTINVNIASLKAKLSEYLRHVKNGTNLVILDHKMPVAKIAPIETDVDFVSVKPSESPSLKGALPSRKSKRNFSSLDSLLEDRRKR